MMSLKVLLCRNSFKKLKELDRNLPIILSSGFSHSSDVDILKKEGLNGFIQKPYNAAALSKAVAKILN